MKRKIVSLLLIFVLAIALLPAYSAFAEQKEDFNGKNALPAEWSFVSEDGNDASVSVGEGVLVIDNKAGASEVRISSKSYDNFVVSFKFKREGGNEKYGTSRRFDMDGESSQAIYPYIGLKYFMANDFASGYEMRIHYDQKGVPQSGYCTLYNDAESISGSGLECRSIADCTAVTDHDGSVIEAFAFFLHRFYENTVYNVDVVVSNGNMDLYIDGELFLTAKYTPQSANGNLCLRVGGESKVTVDDFCISTLQEYAEKCLNAFEEPKTSFKNLAIYKYQRKAENLKKFLNDKFSPSEYQEFDGYKTFKEYLEIFEEMFELDAKDKLTIDIIGEIKEKEFKAGSVVKIPDAVAYDYYENYYKVYVNVYFNDKPLEIVNNQVELNEVGNYNIVYKAVNSKGETFINDDYVISAIEKNNDSGVSTVLIICVTVAFVAVIMGVVELIVTLKIKGGKRK